LIGSERVDPEPVTVVLPIKDIALADSDKVLIEIAETAIATMLTFSKLGIFVIIALFLLRVSIYLA
jgi:hypothetical protein